jgi:fatty acid desaturase
MSNQTPQPTTTEPPVSNWAVAALTVLLVGFVTISLGLLFPAVLLYTTILGGTLVLAANTLAILSLRDVLL